MNGYNGEGLKHGLWDYIDTNRQRYVGYYVNGLRYDIWKVYNEDGSKNQIISYNDKGQAHGLSIKYRPNGTWKYKGYFRNGAKNGEWVNYYSNGKLECKGSYLDGHKCGKWIEYYKSGNIKFDGYYWLSKYDSRCKYYWGNGSLKYVGYYFMGGITKYKFEYNKKGEVILSKYYDNDDNLKHIEHE